MTPAWKNGGPTGSISNGEEYSHISNAGLKIALEFCEKVKSKMFEDHICSPLPALSVGGQIWRRITSKTVDVDHGFGVEEDEKHYGRC
ncbi:hypothetical protein CRG98_035930 [Punica granatum]|uniref:Uncharacterized protein n=1 Tax=Punica granatum TaxID=22663 RepID=A0A2I0II44_PUNGR|nr:hypothetical protein CRG98_035930 [Punica granatum]